MHRDPAREADADGAELGEARRLRAGPARGARLVHPDAHELRVALDEGGVDARVPRQRDHHAREVAHVAPHVAAIGAQVENGVRHELPRRVVGRVAAPRRLVERHAQRREAFARGEHVGDVGGAAEGDRGRVLEKQERVADAALETRRDEALLERVALGVGHPSEPVGEEMSTSGNSSALLR